MREFYLIPKTVYDRYNNNNSKMIGGGDEKHFLSKLVKNSQNHRGMQARVAYHMLGLISTPHEKY